MTEQEKLQLQVALSFLSGRYNAADFVSKQQIKILGLDEEDHAFASQVVYTERAKQIVLTRCEQIVADFVIKALEK